jgi:hypothetical protein
VSEVGRPDSFAGGGVLPLPVVDASQLDEAHRSAFRPDQLFSDGHGANHRLPRYFYQVDSWRTALDTRVAEHFALSELMTVDVREAAQVRKFPRYVPLAVTLLAVHLELLRQALGTYVYVAANGGYRSPAHRLSDHASPHCWGTAANIYRVGDVYLDDADKIERVAKVAARVLPAVWIRPYGHERGFADDHLHLDIDYVRLTPRGHDEDPVR